jgi:hypothetical protein
MVIREENWYPPVDNPDSAEHNERHKQDQLQKQKDGKGHWKPELYVSGEHLSSYSGMFKEELLLVPLKALSLFIFSWDICSRDMSREQQLQNPPRRSNC